MIIPDRPYLYLSLSISPICPSFSLEFAVSPFRCLSLFSLVFTCQTFLSLQVHRTWGRGIGLSLSLSLSLVPLSLSCTHSSAFTFTHVLNLPILQAARTW